MKYDAQANQASRKETDGQHSPTGLDRGPSPTHRRGATERCRNCQRGTTLLYWRIGKRIVNEVLGQERAAYGQQIVVSLIRQLSWTHFITLLPIKNPLQRDFCAELCRAEGW